MTACGFGGGEDGWHRGHVTDVSLSGWFCKTYEGQVMTGSGNASVKYGFTIKSKQTYEKLKEFQDLGVEVNLHYYSPRVYELCTSSHSNIVDDVKATN